MSPFSQVNRELWDFCKMEYKNDAEYAYSKYTDGKKTLVGRIISFFKKQTSSEMKSRAFLFKKGPFTGPPGSFYNNFLQ